MHCHVGINMRVILIRFLQTKTDILAETPSKSGLYAMSGDKINRKNVVADIPNDFASVNTQEIRTDNKAGNLGHT